MLHWCHVSDHLSFPSNQNPRDRYQSILKVPKLVWSHATSLKSSKQSKETTVRTAGVHFPTNRKALAVYNNVRVDRGSVSANILQKKNESHWQGFNSMNAAAKRTTIDSIVSAFIQSISQSRNCWEHWWSWPQKTESSSSHRFSLEQILSIFVQKHAYSTTRMSY